ncbi:hypothetical protein FRC01_001731 [Tulasnella sp. 417]|nr:hypothetical protein FRC01_001731 [Tulasnella sp. 417]
MAPLGTAENPFDIRSPTEYSDSSRSTPSEFSAWDTYPSTVRIRRRRPPQTGPPPGPQPAAAASVNIAGPSSLQRTDNHGREARYQSSGEGTEQSGEGSNQAREEDWVNVQQSDKDPYQSSGDNAGQSDDEQGAEQQLVEPNPEIEEFRRKMNSSIVVGAKMVISAGQKLARTRMFDLEMSEANGGMIFDYDEYSTIVGLLCRIHDSKWIQGEGLGGGPTLIVVPSEAHFEKWSRAAEDFSDRFLGKILVHHGRWRNAEEPFHQYTIVITTYRTLSADRGLVGAGLLQAGLFLRVILDGGEILRNPTTAQSRACLGIDAQYHWCCSQNSQRLLMQRGGSRQPSQPTSMSIWPDSCKSQILMQPMDRRQEFLEQFILGDMDDEIVAAEPTSELEGRSLIFREVRFAARRQREFYQALEKRLDEVGVHHFRPRAMQRGAADAVRRMILLLLKGPEGTRVRRDGVRACGICQARVNPRSVSRFCPGCHEQVISLRPTDTSREFNPKIEEMLRILRQTADAPERRSGKSIIICQFRDFANFIVEHLRQNQWRFAEFDDSNGDEKAEAMRCVKGEQRTKVALATVNPADIHGFDFRPFDTVILMDLWWDPRLDARAFLNRHGVDVNIYKLYFENTVESRVLELLNQPQRIGDGNQDIIHQLGIDSTPHNLDFLLQPT